jgi:hypothetical protein
MRNASVILALLFGYMIAAVTNYQGKKYVITNKIEQAPGITFLWTTTFPLGECVRHACRLQPSQRTASSGTHGGK